MTSIVHFSLSAQWGPRPETSAALARRLLTTIREFQTLDPSFSRWYKGVNGRGVELKLDEDAIAADIAARSDSDGCVFTIKTDESGRGSRVLDLIVNAGRAWRNAVGMGTDYSSVPDPSICTYQIFKPALLAVAENFAAERAFAYPTSLSAMWSRPPRTFSPSFPIAWISYVAPRLTHLVTPPSTAIVEYRPDGGLLMAATDETFDVDNPAHMSVARDIERAVSPLHMRPWEPEEPA